MSLPPVEFPPSARAAGAPTAGVPATLVQGEPPTLTAGVHEAVASVQQAWLWGLEVGDCRGLVLDAFLELTDSAWGAFAHLDRDAGEAGFRLVLDVQRHVPADPGHIEAGDCRTKSGSYEEATGDVRTKFGSYERATSGRPGTATPSIAGIVAEAVSHVHRATAHRAPVVARLSTSRATPAGRAAGPSLDWLLVLAIPGGSGPSSVVLLARGAGGYTDTLTAGIEPLLRLTGQMDIWAGEREGRRATERELAGERRRLGLALEASDVGVFEFNATTGALQWDARLWAMHGLSPRTDDWTLDDWARLVHPDDSHRAVADLRASIEDQQPLQTQYRIRLADGEVRHIRSNARVFEHEGGARVVVGVNRDVTADVRLHQELAAERTQAEAATRAKSTFLATMSHEIRTPMNGVLGMLELLLAGGLTSAQQERASTAHASAECLLRILDDILDLSKLENHQVSVESIPYQPARVIADTVALLVPRATEKHLRVTREIDAGMPAWISGDPMRLRQVVLNLTGNAIKFTSEGQVTVRARVDLDDPARPLLRVEITDTGEGIAPEAQARLFQQFVQADSTTSRRFGGTGLGLAISRQLVELMGGRIGLTSAPGQGSTFWFAVPAIATVPPTLREVPSPESPNPTRADDVSPLRILVVDDNAVNRRLAQAFLVHDRHVVRTADGGTEALAVLASEPFDLVLLDVQMPVMDGPTCLGHIRTVDGPVRAIPVIALTANAMAGDRERYLAAGFTDYVSKPMTMRSLSEAIARVRAGVSPRS